MHLLDVERHFLGGWGIVGGQLPIAVGAALALDYREQAERGARASSATARPTSAPSTSRSTWPRSGTCRSSSRSSTTATAWARRVEKASAEPEQWKRAAAYRMHGERVDGNDLLAVREAADRLLRARARGARSRRCSRRRPTASAGTRWPTRARSTATPRRSPRRASATRSTASLRRGAGHPDAETVDAHPHARSTTRSTRRSARPRPAPAPDPDSLFDNVYGDAETGASSSRRMARGGPFGEREGTRSWRT